MKNKIFVPVLTADKTVCTIGEVKIKLHQTIDYKSATERRTSMGKVVDMKYAGWRQEDKGSVWMRIVDTQDTSQSEWVSVILWHHQYLNGLFGNIQKQPANESEEFEAAEDLPF